MPKKNALLLVLYVLLFSLIPSAQAHAYLDPGSGSLIIQILAAALLSLVVVARVFKDTILAFLGFKRSSEDEDDDLNSESDSE
jgi:hypothetical protein